MIRVLNGPRRLAAEFLCGIADCIDPAKKPQEPWVPEEIQVARSRNEMAIRFVQPSLGMFGPIWDPLSYEDEPEGRPGP